MGNLQRKMAKGAAWMILMRLTERLLGLVSTAVLARLLVPEDFGLVAMATAVFAFLEIMGAFSFDLALVQNQNAERRHYDTAWTFSVLFGIAAAIVLSVLAIPAAHFYAEPRVAPILWCLAFSALIQGFENIGIVAFQKDLELHKDFYFKVAKRIVAVLVTIAVAATIRNYWALIVGMVTSRAIGVVLSYRMHPYRPRLSIAAKDDLFHFSKWMLINNILGFFTIRGIDFIIGRIVGARALGLYSVAYEISNLPTTELVFPIGRAIFPGFARMADDVAALRQNYLDVLGLIAILAIPAGLGIVALAEPLVHVFLGANWTGAERLIEVLGVYGVLRACSSHVGTVVLALGRVRLLAWMGTATVGMLIPLMTWWVHEAGVNAAGWSLIVVSATMIAVYVVVLNRLIDVSPGDLLARLWRPLVAASAMLLLIGHFRAMWPSLPSAIQLLLLIPFGAAVYTVTVVVCWFASGRSDGAEQVILQLALRKWRVRRAAMGN